MQSFIRTLVVAVVAFHTCHALAENTTATGTIEIIDATSRTLTMQVGGKSRELQISKKAVVTIDGKAAESNDLVIGQSVKVSFDPDLDLITKIEAASVKPTDDPGFVDLIKADSLDGWFFWARPTDKTDSKTLNWEVKNGVLTNIAPGRQLVSDRKFRNFELEFDFQVPAKCNSGIYLRGRYELKLKDSDPLQTSPEERCGAIFRQIAPSANAFLGPRKWNKVRVVLVDKKATVVMNDKTIIEEKELKAPGPSGFDMLENEPGPIMLHSRLLGVGIKFRNMRIKEL